MPTLEELAGKMNALGHPMRLRIATLLAKEGSDMYLNEIANNLGINRALAKIHLKKLERANIVKSRVVLVEDEARALRYYRLQEFEIHVSPNLLRKEVSKNGN